MSHLDELRLLAQQWNQLSDSAYERIQLMRSIGVSQSLIDEAMLAAGRARGVAARLDEQVGHLEATR